MRPAGSALQPASRLSDAGPDGAAVRGFPPELGSASQARHFVADLLESRAGEVLAESAAIVIGELAANAVLHARSAFTVAVSYPRGAVRIAVRDAVRLDTCGPLVTIPGHGLDVVGKVAVRWAAEPLPDGKIVWAELDTAGQDEKGKARVASA
ncbi:MAG TPA: ATP-binding protein [Streptosporangiaceae bacterium]